MTTPGSLRPRRSMRGETGDRHHEVQVAAELVDRPHVARDEGRALDGAEIRTRQRGGGVSGEPRPELRVLLETVQQAVDGVAAHQSRHSTAARLIRGSSPK